MRPDDDEVGTWTDGADTSRPVSGHADPEAVDPSALDAVLRVGGVALLERLVEVAEGNVRQRLDQVDAALGAVPPDHEGAERAAHSVKSSAAYVGAEALRAHAAAMETDAREGRVDGLADRVREARELLELVLPALRREVSRRS